MPSIFRKNTTGWVEILSVFRKNTTGWVEILNAYRKNTTDWVKVFARSQIPGIISFPKVRNSSGDDINNTTVIARVGDTLTGYRGSWSNSPTAYEDRWYFNQYASGGNYGPFSPAQTNTTLSTNLSHDGYYVVYQVRATNASGSSEYVTSSNEARVVKYAPVSLSISNLNGSPVVGGTLTAGSQSSLWQNTTSISGDTSPDSYEYEWSYSDGTILQFNSSNSYLIDPDDLGKTIRVRVTGTNTGGSATSGYTTSGTVTAPYSFNFGNILYVGSNGYITLDQAPPTPAIAALQAGNGRTINIWNTDLVNYRIQEYSDSNNYHLYFRAYMYQDPLVRSSITALDYQIKFYTGQPYCDVYLVRKGSSVPAYINDPGYYSNGLFGTSGFSGTFVAGSVLRVYFDGTTPANTSAASWTAISDSVWKSISTSDIDDSYVAVTTSANQQASVLTAPSITSVSSTTENSPVTAYFSGGSGPYYQIYWTTGVAPGSGATPDAEGSSSPLTDNTGPATTGYTYYMYVRSVSSLGETSAGPSSLASDWSSGFAFTVSSANLTPPTITNVTAGNSNSQPVVVYFSGGSGPYYQIWWWSNSYAPPTGNSPDAYGSSSPLTDSTGPGSAGTYYAFVRSVAVNNGSATGGSAVPSTTFSNWSSGFSFTVTQAPIIPTVSMNANTNITTSGATINWSSSNQSYSTVNGTNIGFANSYTFSGLSSSTSYSGTVTVYSSTGNSASANYSFTTNSSFVTPSISLTTNPPAFARGGASNNIIGWAWNNASYSGSTSGNPSYPWRIRSGSSSGTIIASGTRSYSSGFVSLGGNSYNYRIGSEEGDTPRTTASRWGSYQATILGTNGQTYSTSYSASV